MCRRHESTLAGTVRAPWSARRFVARECADLDVRDLTETAQLLASELVTNSVVHAHASPTVGVSLTCGRLVIDVRDSDAARPSVRDVEADSASGRGLALVSMLADEWGVEPLSEGKSIWFALHPRRLPAYAAHCPCGDRSDPGVIALA